MICEHTGVIGCSFAPSERIWTNHHCGFVHSAFHDFIELCCCVFLPSSVSEFRKVDAVHTSLLDFWAKNIFRLLHAGEYRVFLGQWAWLDRSVIAAPKSPHSTGSDPTQPWCIFFFFFSKVSKFVCFIGDRLLSDLHADYPLITRQVWRLGFTWTMYSYCS